MTSTPPQLLGRRAKLTQSALEKASDKVIKTLTDERMAQCFPSYKEDLVKALRSLVVERYMEGIPIAWDLVINQWDFVEKANELDRIIGVAEESRTNGSRPLDLYLKGADPKITVPPQTVPVLKKATNELRAKRMALQAKNNSIYTSISDLDSIHSRTESQIKEILIEFKLAMKDLEDIDMTEEDDLREELVTSLS